MSADLAWALLFIAGVSGLLMLLAWLEPKRDDRRRLQSMSRAPVLEVTARDDLDG